ncbi:MAG: CTP synthase [Candidatus Uhrbacteria bacterium]|nr:CTP synthase [Candidatus Uhrbacteria bacterium]
MLRRRTYIFVSGGVMSGVGKGVVTASIGALLKASGLRVTAIKIDPYLNVDPGTLNPIEHGEVFVTKDGIETDQDLGNYERFLDEDLTRLNVMTSGSVFQSIIARERALGYGGRTVEWVPDVPLEIIGRIKRASEAVNVFDSEAQTRGADVTLIEIGGTVGEYQNLLYLEACRMMRMEAPNDVLLMLVSYLPVPPNLGEMKTKPTQYAVRSLNAAGLQPDIIICRSQNPIDDRRKQKLSIACSVRSEDMFAAPNVSSIYEIPLRFAKEGVADRVLEKLHFKKRSVDLRQWKALTKRIRESERPVRIGIVGKYASTGNFLLTDTYLSVLEAIKHAAWTIKRKPEIVWLNAEELESSNGKIKQPFKGLDGILVPGGFGTRGVEGKIRAIRYAREKKVPYLGLCYGLQLATIEFARHVLKRKDAHTTEIVPTCGYPVIHLMNEQEERIKNKDYGGTMRLGAYPCLLQQGTLARKLYGKERIVERHRHRYECNPLYRCEFEAAGLLSSGLSPDGALLEMIELKGHPFFLASQFHPEFLSRPFHPHPLFVGFLKAAAKRSRK